MPDTRLRPLTLALVLPGGRGDKTAAYITKNALAISRCLPAIPRGRRYHVTRCPVLPPKYVCQSKGVNRL